jgi:Flp pilus assembly protein CpaB
MEATHKRSPGEDLRRFVGTRKGAMIVAALAAALAGVVLLAFISQYRNSVRGGTVEKSALVADRLIPKGTSGAVVVGDGLFKPTTVQEDNLKAGALSGAAALQGKVATRDIYPGEQITADAFASNADPLRGQLRGNQRAIAIPLDGPHGLLGQIRSGDHVDVLAGFSTSNGTTGRGSPQLRTLIQNVLVLSAPSDSGSATDPGKSASLTVRVSADQAGALAFASDNGKIWFLLRPPAGAKDVPPSSVTLDSLLSGTPAIQTGGGGR